MIDIEVFWNRIKDYKVIDPVIGCWLYTGGICPSTGYGRIKIGSNKRTYVHRISAAYHYGLDMNNNKSFACHKPICPNRRCFNPDHIYVGNNQSNQRDVLGGYCSGGHSLAISGRRANKNVNSKRYCTICRNNRVRANKRKAA